MSSDFFLIIFVLFCLSFTITALRLNWRAALNTKITPRSIVFVRKRLTEPITLSHCFFFSLRARASVQLANEPRKKMLTVFLPLYSGHSVCLLQESGRSNCRSAGGDSSAWKIIFNIPADNFLSIFRLSPLWAFIFQYRFQTSDMAGMLNPALHCCIAATRFAHLLFLLSCLNVRPPTSVRMMT